MQNERAGKDIVAILKKEFGNGWNFGENSSKASQFSTRYASLVQEECGRNADNMKIAIDARCKVEWGEMQAALKTSMAMLPWPTGEEKSFQGVSVSVGAVEIPSQDCESIQAKQTKDKVVTEIRSGGFWFWAWTEEIKRDRTTYSFDASSVQDAANRTLSVSLARAKGKLIEVVLSNLASAQKEFLNTVDTWVKEAIDQQDKVIKLLQDMDKLCAADEMNRVVVKELTRCTLLADVLSSALRPASASGCVKKLEEVGASVGNVDCIGVVTQFKTMADSPFKAREKVERRVEKKSGDEHPKAKLPDGPLSQWTVDDVGKFLEAIGKANLVSKFAENDVDGSILVELDADTITDSIGTNKLVSLSIAKAVAKALEAEK